MAKRNALQSFVAKTFRLEEPPMPVQTKEPEIVTGEAEPRERNPITEIMLRKRRSSAGTDIYAGYYAEEFLSKLRGNKLAKEMDKVWRSDAQVRMLINAVLNPISSAKYEIQPAGETPEEQKQADLIKHILFSDMNRPFNSTMRQAGSVLKHGHALMEKTFKLVMDHPEFGTYHGIASLDLISQKTIEKWNLNADSGELESITQISQGDLQKMENTPIERKYFLLFVLDQEGANYEGVSWLRPCYGNWFRKNNYLKLNAIGIEKFAVPTPVVEFPQGVQNDEQFENIIAALEVYTSGQSNYMTLPAGFKVEMKPNGFDPTKVEMSIDKEDIRMAKAFLANFLELGLNGSGSYSLSNDFSDFFLSGITHVADELLAPFNVDLIPELIKLNFGAQAKYPKIIHSGITDKAGDEFAKMMQALISSKVITPDDPLEAHVRKRMNLPEMSEEGRRDVTPPSPFGAGQPQVDEDGKPIPPKPGQPAPKPGEKPKPGEEKEQPEEKGKTLSERILRKLYAQ